MNRQLGKYGQISMELQKKKYQNKKQQYSVSLVAAISQTKVVSSQMIEGGVDSTVFENFIYHTLRYIRTDPQLSNKTVILLMDNAVIHKQSLVLETARRMKVNVLFNAEYSPWLNPVEELFRLIKARLKPMKTDTK